MLTSLRVRDLAVLEDVEVSFGEGLTVLTGETGAGKSLVVDALSLLAGERADPTLVRAGAERLVVEGSFASDGAALTQAFVEAGLASEGEEVGDVVVRREVASGGRGRLFVNGSPAALRALSDVSPRLLVLYGQAEARELLDPAAPRELLDRFGGLHEPAEKVAALHRAYREKEAERDRLTEAATDRTRRLELLDFQIKEIDAVKPQEGEDERLAAEKAVLSNVDRVGKLLSETVSALESEDGGALPALGAARKALQGLAEIDAAWASRVAECADAVERVSELARAASRELDRLEADPVRLAAVAERLDGLARLKRKYGATLGEVLAHRGAIGSERDTLGDLEGALARASAGAKAAFDEYRRAALELSAARAAAAPRLARAVERHLKDLAFAKSLFGVAVQRREDARSAFEAGRERVAFGSHGIDQVTFTFAPNPGEPARALSRIASGGELARIQLALAAALAEEETAGDARRRKRSSPPRTFVFDEVDAGVSGAVAEAVGRKLRALASREQVLVVTHLPQVAASGEHHLCVTKEVSGGRTRTRVEELEGKERVEAIAALLAGASIGDAARAHAKQLLAALAKP